MNDRIAQTFDKIHAEDALILHTKEFLAVKTRHFSRKPVPAARKIAVAMACFLLFFIGGSGYLSWFTSISTISIDVNPSIELDVNRFDRVISVRSYNEDGDFLLADTDLRFLDYREALHLLLETEDMQPYYSPDSLIAVTVFGSDESRKDEMLSIVTDCTSMYRNVHCSSGDSMDASDAHASGMSCGKYQAYLELYSLDPSVTTEDVQKLTMRQIRDRIQDLSKGGYTQPDSEREHIEHHEEEDHGGGNQNSDKNNVRDENQNTNKNQNTNENKNSGENKNTSENQNTNPDDSPAKNENRNENQNTNKNQSGGHHCRGRHGG